MDAKKTEEKGKTDLTQGISSDNERTRIGGWVWEDRAGWSGAINS